MSVAIQLPKLNPSQQLAIQAIRAFLNSTTPVFLLLGSAGTGKTTLVSHIIRMLDQEHRPFQVIAPTGRAARILGQKAGAPASTIHGCIYALPNVEVIETAVSRNDPGMRLFFPKKHDDPLETIFIVDESSMVGDKESKGDFLQFGSGRLLADLIEFARLGRIGRSTDRGAKIIFVGDPAQLPPVGETLSPALSEIYLKDTFDLGSEKFELLEVMRQQAGSAVLDQATLLRDAITNKIYNTFNISPTGDEIVAASISAGVSVVEEAYRSATSSVLITYSNAQALKLNQSVRHRLWGDECADPRKGDLLLINKNSAKTGLSNGDLVKIRDVAGDPERRCHKLKVKDLTDGTVHDEVVALIFRRATIVYREADGSVRSIDCQLLENLLHSGERELESLEQRALLVDFRKRHPHLRPKTAEFTVAIRDDPYFNALHVKYGYAMTCHKAQGGEWPTAVVDFGGYPYTRSETFYRWAYTAITRAKAKLITISAPNVTAVSEIVWGALRPPASVPAPTADGSDPTTDPDWNRFAFNPGHERLFEYHGLLRDAWGKEGIGIERLDHLQYAERYLLVHSDRRASLQYHYKGNLKVSSIGPASGSVSDPDFQAVALKLMRQALMAVPQPDAPLSDPFLAEFYDKLQQVLGGTEIRLVAAQPMQYCLRVEFIEAGYPIHLDFHYNSKKVWTSAREVGAPGSSRGLIDRLRQLMEEHR